MFNAVTRPLTFIGIYMNTKLVAEANLHNLSLNPHLGRFLAIGVHESGKDLVQIYAMMKKDSTDRNYVLKNTEKDPGCVYAQAVDISTSNKEITELDRHFVMLEAFSRIPGSGRQCFVGNGNQVEEILFGDDSSLGTFFQKYNFNSHSPCPAPRITGQGYWYGGNVVTEFSVIQKTLGSTGIRPFIFSFDGVEAGFAFGVHTHLEGEESVQGQPVLLPVTGSITEIAQKYWDSMNEVNRMSLVVKFIPKDSSPSSVHVINKCKAD